MTNLEQQVWAAAYAAEFNSERRFIQLHDANKTVEDVHGYSCAEVADVAVKKLREALTGPDHHYLLPSRESTN